MRRSPKDHALHRSICPPPVDAPAHEERGAIAVWASMAFFAFILAIGIGVDFSGHVRTSQEARLVAAQAARAGGQHLSLASGRALPDTAGAVAAATRHGRAAGWTATARVDPSGRIHVTLTGDHDTHFLSIIGIWTLPVQETASASVVSVVDGEQA